MRKFYRKIPPFIYSKISTSEDQSFEVASILKLYVDQIGSNSHRKLGITLDVRDNIVFGSLIPDTKLGKYSIRNAEGHTLVRKDLPKVWKTFNIGERPIYGDWSKGSFSLDVTRLVFQREKIPAKDWEIKATLVSNDSDEGGEYILVKISVGVVLDKSDGSFEDDLLLAINLLHETNGKVDIFLSDASNMDYITNISVDWEIFPPGTRDHVSRRILSGKRGLSDQDIHLFNDRLEFLESLGPIRWVKGLGGSNAYFGAILREDLVVFENIRYGNAIYVLFEDWLEISKLSRTEILAADLEFVRIVHTPNWKNELRRTIKNRLAA